MLLENPKVNTTSGISYSLQSLNFARTVPEWNHPHIRNASSVDCFKSSLMRDYDIKDLINKSHYYD